MKNIILIKFILVVLACTAYGQNSKSQLCTANCLIQDSFSFQIKELPIYVGDSWADENFTEYVQVDEYGIADSIQIVKDTANCKYFYLDYYQVKRLVRKGGYTEKCRVLCKSKRTTYFYRDLRIALEENGFSIESSFSSDLEFETKKALILFQKKHMLPVGHLDYETLKILDLKNYIK